jgi:excisionase family DNA binding protein
MPQSKTALADPPLPAVLDTTIFARLLRVSRPTFLQWHRSGKLPAPLNLPGRRRWSRETVLSWLREGGVR